MARPQTGRHHSRVITHGVDIVLVLDTSGSMQALDLDKEKRIQQRRNRLEVAKAVVRAFVEERADDQIGLVVFGEDAYTQCPLTLDHGVVVTLLDKAEIGMAGDSTAIGSAIGVATKRLKDSKAKSKVIVLLTDGRNNAGSLSPRKAAEVAETFGVKIYTIGVGTRGKAPFIVDTGIFGKRIHYQAVDLDEPALREVAKIAEGRYFRATDARSLEEIYATINELEKTKIEVKKYLEHDERFAWFTFPALALLLLEMLLLGTRLRKIP
jgi:Ca-activated chloride channel family protein